MNQYVKALNRAATTLVIATGPPGTGKTMLACKSAVGKIANGEYDKVVLTRPLVPVGGESLGHLPGTLEDKAAPWMSHMVQYTNEYDLEFLKSKIHTLPLAYMRGHTFHNSWILADEMQNSTVMQMKTLLTRVGQDSKIVITGDLSQSDLDEHENGLNDLILRLNGNHFAEHVRFTEKDIQRSEFVKNIFELYDK